MSVETMEDLLVEELRDLYSAEKQLVKALPKMAKAATNEQLMQAFESHLTQTEGHVTRLEKCFELLGVAARAKHCKGMAGLIEEGDEATEVSDDEDVCDAAIIGAAQRVEHYEIAAYGTARAFATGLGHTDLADILTETLEEEGAADKLLTSIAESEVNYAAMEEEASVASEKSGKRRTKQASS